MRILHTEASTGLGGQELRILRESEGMRQRGHEVVIAVALGGRLAKKARDAGFTVYELPFERKFAFKALFALRDIVKRHNIDIINTHSSRDAWLAGLLGRLMNRALVRTRHLSTPSRAGLNSFMLYRALANVVVTTCQSTAELLRVQANLPDHRCRSIPTGVDPLTLRINTDECRTFRHQHGIKDSDVVVGSVCVLRFWKGISDMLQAAKLLQSQPNLKWLVVGDGPSAEVFKQLARDLGIEHQVIFTGHLDNPYIAMASMDIFLLLSYAHEGVSQAVLQAAYLKIPLVTTSTGGLGEVCLDGKTGFIVTPHDSQKIAQHVQNLANSPSLRQTLGENGHTLVCSKFTLEHTLNAMEEVYTQALLYR